MSLIRWLGWLFVAGLAAWPRVARAEIYEIFIDVRTPDELDELRRTDQIGARTHRVLLELLRQGVDLRTAPRSVVMALPNLAASDVETILVARRRGVRVDTPAALVAARLLDPSRAAALQGFLRTSSASAGGEVRIETAWLAVDRRPPPVAVAVRGAPQPGLDLGFTMISVRDRAAPPRWDRVRQALVAAPALPSFEPALYHLAWTYGRWRVVAGTYALGFGQGLVLDTTQTSAPEGAMPVVAIARPLRAEDACPWSAAEGRVPECGPSTARRTPDFVAPAVQQGVTVGFVQSNVSAYAFGWMRSPRLRASEITIPSACGSDCETLEVYAMRGDPLAPALQWRRPELPGVVTEFGSGGHLGASPVGGLCMGLTGYAVVPRWRVGGVRLDFARSARAPPGGPYGALGLELAWARGPSRLRIDVAHGFDGADRLGGPAFIVEERLQWPDQQLAWHGRWYAPNYDNPWSGATAAVDRADGLSTKDEMGSGLRFDGRLGTVARLHAMVDASSTARPRHLGIHGRLRVELRPRAPTSIALWSAGWRTRAAPRECSGATAVSAFDPLDPDESIACGRARIASGVRVGGTVRERIDVAVLGVHTVRSDRPQLAAVSHDARAMLTLRAAILDEFDVRGHVGWSDDDLRARSRGASSIGTMVAPRVHIGAVDLEVRYDLRVWIDRRASTATRRPNPEHWIHAQLSWRF